MLRVGLTGGIATGKSHVRRRFEAAGLATLDLDHVTHQLLQAGATGQRAVAQEFGGQLLAPDGGVDRRALGALVFRDRAARERLNALLHPLIRVESERRAEALAAGGAPVVVTEAALLVETGAHLARFDRLVVVYCPEARQRERLMERDGLAAEAADARLRAQLSIERKRLFAHLAIDSSGTREQTDTRADAAADDLLTLARQPPARVQVSEAAALGCLLHGPQRGPRGLTPRLLLASIAASGGLDLQACAAALDPPHDGPWYRAAELHVGGPGPETLAGPLALWALARRGADEVFLAGAAASLARLTHDDATSIGRAVLAAGLVYDAAAGSESKAALSERAAHWVALGAAFGGAGDLAEVASVSKEPEIVGALRGLAVGPGEAVSDASLGADLRRLQGR